MYSLTEKCWFWRWSLLISGLYWWIVLLERQIEFSSLIRLNDAADFLIPLIFWLFRYLGYLSIQKWKIDSKKWVRFAELVWRRIALGLWPFETLGVGNLCEALTAFVCLFLITRGLGCYEENAGVFVFVIPPVWLSTCSVMLSTCSVLKMEREEGGMVSCS